MLGGVLFAPATASLAASPAPNRARPTDAGAMHGASLTELAASADAMDNWREYALGSLKSNFSWASEPGELVAPPSIFNRGRSSYARTPVSRFTGTSVEEGQSFHVAMQSARIADTPLYTAASNADSLLPDYSPGLQRTLIAPSFTRPLDDLGYWRVSLILAYQKFSLATPAPVASAYPFPAQALSNPSELRYKESSVGFGTRLDVGGNLIAGLDWHAGFQSRVAMNNFYTYRGIYGQPGSFDIPPSTDIGVDFTPVPGLRLSVDAERILYAQITPFASYSLPADFRYFLQLSRTNLAWSDLDVYSVAASWRNKLLGEFTLRYSTREQPLPTLPVLQQLLQPQLASHDWEFGYAHGVGERSQLRFKATYAPIQLLGVPSYTADNNYGANRMRYEMLWMTAF